MRHCAVSKLMKYYLTVGTMFLAQPGSGSKQSSPTVPALSYYYICLFVKGERVGIWTHRMLFSTLNCPSLRHQKRGDQTNTMKTKWSQRWEKREWKNKRGGERSQLDLNEQWKSSFISFTHISDSLFHSFNNY